MSGTNYPLVTVGIPTFNGAHRIEKAISSLLSQDYPNLEIIISDNASLDNTRELCENYSRINPRITYHRQKRNLGLLPNFEYLLHVAKGEYFIFLSDDDALAPNILKKYVDFLENNEDHVLVCGKVNYWTGEDLYDYESGLSFQQESPMLRTLLLYKEVKFSGLIHGMFRLEEGKKLRLKSILGNDWHFLAALAYRGKVFQMEETGYEKSGDGTSSNFRKYAYSMGENFLWSYAPFVKIAIDAFKEILYKEKAFRTSNLPLRFLAGILSSSLILFQYYLKIVPRIWAGKILRAFNMKTPREKRVQNHQKKILNLEKKAIM